MSNYLPEDSFKVCSYFIHSVAVMWAYRDLCVMAEAEGTQIYWTAELSVQENGNFHIYLLKKLLFSWLYFTSKLSLI